MKTPSKMTIGIIAIAALAVAGIVIYIKNKPKGVNVKKLGAIGDGIANDTEAIQKAIDTNDAVYLPKGNYLVDGLKLKTGSTITGDGIGKTMITRGQGVAKDSSSSKKQEWKYADSLISAYSDSFEEVLKDISISNITLYGQSDKMEFVQFEHLINFCNVENVTVKNTELLGFRGDGVYFGGIGLIDGKERHNKNAVVKNCKFDGINKNNRNGISVIDCTNLMIDGCSFINTTAPDMPSAIDIEPDNSFNIVNGITISNCTFDNIGGNVGVIVFAINDHNYPHPPTNLNIVNNKMSNSSTDAIVYQLLKNGGIVAGENIVNLLIDGNVITKCKSPFFISNASGVKIQNNTFEDCTSQAFLSYPNLPNAISYDTAIINNKLIRVGKNSGVALTVFDADGLVIENNSFVDSGVDADGTSIDFNKGVSKNVKISKNTFSSKKNAGLALNKQPSHKFVSETALIPSDNTFNSLSQNIS